ncbi:MAG: BrnA antitoxin family protein [Alphaproteobacteria bacterium]|nr:BrnA antitoxin family protein [Alphaproteobacteria bacterium]
MERSAGVRSVKSTEDSTLFPTRSVKKATKKSTASSRREKPHLVSVRLTKKRPKLTPELKAELDALAALPDDQIDFSDIPELTDQQIRNGPIYVGLFPMPGTRKKSITIRLDEDVVRWFKKQGKGWQTKMNWVLRLYFASHRKTGVKVGRP